MTRLSLGSQVEWSWLWRRQAFSPIETQQLHSCLNALSQIHLNTSTDEWIWTKDDSGTFTVASMRKLLQDPNSHSNFVVQWNNWVPIKVNIFGWRAEMERIATGTALSQRGISLDTTCCPLCGDYEETATHLLTSCYVANMVWQHISSWCKIPPIFAFSVRDILEIHKSVGTSKEKKKRLFKLSSSPRVGAYGKRETRRFREQKHKYFKSTSGS
ncbi:hypothetical protein QVD17_15455 [Tagetes erecta]|uniref:Reverse transcriptase zinc-binding domain-containing protein n=1 Tax=Tagetes erecta TaxID=13708 RepID=A0AAD8KVZ0_TARER|nr:hypothetical protein QVD17_15455 [Tagetes erecta]